ncbi:MAG TPA: hypothetical protein VNL70_03215, partial [Tepidisphaeraceae bacterium]|nr:hypothetical protein [Tepidisphaeraceae bacterium]
MDMHLSAAWVWLGEDFHQYNQAVLFHKAVQIDGVPAEARLAFSADSEARIFVNGTWIADGPCRGWPHAYYYDVVELPGVLRAGENQILAVARYFGSGTFHQIPQQAGFLLQLDVKDSAGQWHTLAATDHTWRAAPFLAWRQTCPKMCVQMGPGEWIDARRGDACLPAIQQPIDQPVSLIAPAHAGPWGRLRPRDVALPGRYQVQVPAPSAARVVKAVPQLPWAVPVRRLCHPQV